jgi:hypothetical protein
LVSERNEPCTLVHIAEVVASLRGVKPKLIAESAHRNSLKMLELDKHRPRILRASTRNKTEVWGDILPRSKALDEICNHRVIIYGTLDQNIDCVELVEQITE